MPQDEKTLLILIAHADDTEFLAGGAVARFADEGYRIYEVIATNNERGSHELDRETIIAQSREEARQAARILGKQEVLFLDYSDGMLSDTPLNELREKFMRLIRKYRPRILLTFDPWAPFEAHPDHRAVALAATEAASFAQNPKFHPEHLEQGLKPHQVAEIYYFAKNNINANRVVDITEYMDQKISALLAHDSQMKLTIDEARIAIKAVGRFNHLLPLLDRNNAGAAIETLMRTWASIQAADQPFEYGETFRWEPADAMFEIADEKPADG